MHIPVLKKEVLEYLNPKPNENFIDCTIGDGGHDLTILEMNKPNGKILGIDWDPKSIHRLKLKIQNQFFGKQTIKFKNNLILICDNFINLKKIIQKQKFKVINGILFDLGMSSWQLEKSGMGFSFLRDEPLDMRMRCDSEECQTPCLSHQSYLTAEIILNTWSKLEIEKILREYSQERFAKKISKEIIIQRKIKPIKNTFQLNKIIKKAVPLNYEKGRIHPSTRTFQSLRIAVNKELDNLKIALPQALEALALNGKLVVISFHSLEDQIVKKFFREKSEQGLIKILTKKPVKPTEKEIRTNPRSRSAKLRAAVKI